MDSKHPEGLGSERRRHDDRVELIVGKSIAEVKTEIATLNGTMASLAGELRAQTTQVSSELERVAAEQARQHSRLTTVEKWQWRVTGIAGVVAAFTGAAVATMLDMLT